MNEIFEVRERSLRRLREIYGDEAEVVIAGARYGFISGLIKEVVRKPAVEGLTLSDRIDRVVISRWLGIPAFLAIMYAIFQLTFTLSGPLTDLIVRGLGWIGEKVSVIGGWAGSLLEDGIIGGVGTVLSFIPPIFLLFLSLSFLEDLGYLARAAFLIDRIMHKVGLHGRSFIPMVLGFGCNVPAIMATRVIENPKERLTTILIAPFMSCGARLPIYVLFAAAFFPAHKGLVVLSMYLIGIAIAIITSFVLRRWVISGPGGHFVMELPPYRLPTVKGIIIHTWERGRGFLIRAGTVILAISAFAWLISYIGFLEPMGRAIAPIFKPCGFGEWQAAVSFIFGFLAKETVVGTLGTLFGGASSLAQVIGAELGWDSLTAFSFMVFSLLYIPCLATIATIRHETNSWRWTVFAISYSIAVAWVVSTSIYQIGRLFI